jgi:ABC-type Fe3+ transport system permease subunit
MLVAMAMSPSILSSPLLRHPASASTTALTMAGGPLGRHRDVVVPHPQVQQRVDHGKNL